MNKQIKTGDDLIRSGKVAEALHHFDLMVETDPRDHLAIYYTGLCHLKLDNVASAILHFDRALELQPDEVNYLADRAVAKSRANDRTGALLDLDKCILLRPDHSYLYSLRAFIKNHFSDTEGAIADYRKAIELDPEDPIALNNLGLCEESLGYRTEAQRHFESADRLSGIQQRTPEHHVIELKGERPSAGRVGMGTYLRTMWTVLTDPDERAAFFRFTASLLRGKRTDR